MGREGLRPAVPSLQPVIRVWQGGQVWGAAVWPRLGHLCRPPDGAFLFSTSDMNWQAPSSRQLFWKQRQERGGLDEPRVSGRRREAAWG